MTAKVGFDLPQDRVFAVGAVNVSLDPAPHPFEAEHRAAIADNWRRETAANPALFDGEVALLSSLVLRGGDLTGRCHIVRYSTFLFWRTLRPIPDAGHAYAHAVLVGADNALVAIRMGSKTVNAGQVYFAAGSFEPVDFRDGVADLEFNMHREVLEETGIDISRVEREDAYHGIAKSTGTALFKRYFLDLPGEEIAARIRAHVATESEPEIAGPVVMRNATDLPERLAPQMPDLIAWHFANPPRR
jgi:8-oxo-dGTP pyrophosphatase MutT (NUDIX family)